MLKLIKFLIFSILFLFSFKIYAFDILMSDSIGSFFEEGKEIKHFSNNPFYQIDLGSGSLVSLDQLNNSKKKFEKYIDLISKNSYNSISLDDLNHVINLKKIFNSDSNLAKRNEIYINYYKELIKIAHDKNIKVFLTTDMQFYNDEILKNIGELEIENKNLENFNKKAISQVFEDLGIDGIILRIGEGGKAYNTKDYKSKIIYKTPKEVNNLLKNLLPVFEKYDKILIFRTWSIGIGDIGDIIWNKKTYDETFFQIFSPNLIVSIKHTPGDFFWFEKLNPTIGYGNLKQIVEIQVRREYEGGGDFPNYMGDEYEKIYKEISLEKNVIGVWNWNQTGGWGWGKNVIFSFGFNFWNELNFFAVGEILKGTYERDKFLDEYLNSYKFSPEEKKVLKEIIISSRDVIKYGLYINDFRQKKIKLGNIILPPLLRTWWDRTTSSPIILSLIYNSLDDKIKTIEESSYYLGIQKKQLEDFKKVMGNSKLESQIYNSLLDRYKIFEINHIFKKSFIEYFNTGEKKYFSEIKEKIEEYENFKKDKSYVNYDFSEIKRFYDDYNGNINLFFYLNLFSFLGFLGILLFYGLTTKHKKNIKHIINISFLLFILVIFITPFFFLRYYNIYWVFVKLNYLLMFLVFLYFFIINFFISKIFKIEIKFKFSFQKILYYFAPIIIFLEVIIILSFYYGEMFLWKVLGIFILSNNFNIYFFIFGLFYLLLFFIYGYYFSNIYRFIKVRKRIILLLFIGFVFYLFITYFLDYKKIFFHDLIENFIPSYFIEAGSDVGEYFK